MFHSKFSSFSTSLYVKKFRRDKKYWGLTFVLFKGTPYLTYLKTCQYVAL